MQKRTIYLYWVGNEYTLISILRILIYIHSTNGIGYKVILITDENIKDYVSNIPHYFNNLHPAHKADFVRVNVICDYGGIWLDSDTLVLDSLDSLFDIIDNNNGFFIKEGNHILINGIFGSRANTQLMIKWRLELMTKLDNKQGEIHWTEIGNEMLQNIFKTNKSLYDEYKIFNGLNNLYPVIWNECVNEFINKPYNNFKKIMRDYQPLIVLVNSVYKKLNKLTEPEILKRQIPLTYFINKSLLNKGICKTKLYTNQNIYTYSKSDYISKSIIEHKCWEPSVSNIFNYIIKNNINPQSVVFDIGCNIGYYSIICAKNKSLSKIYSIDANVDNINMLNMSCLLNGIKNIQTLNLCVSEKIGQFYNSSNKEYAIKVGNIGGIAYSKVTDIKSSENIISTTIDELIKINNISDIVIMKIDCEGGELNILKGGSNTLKNNIIKNIIIEISPKLNNDSIEILQILIENNYHLYNIPYCENGNYRKTNVINNMRNYPIIDIYNFVKSIGDQTNILATRRQPVQYYIYNDWIKYLKKLVKYFDNKF